jgi:cell division initiation protein
MDNVKIKKALFGYSKKGVNEFILQFNKETEDLLNLKQDKIDDLEAEVERLKGEIEKLNSLLAEEKNKSELVTMALVNAERKAREIVDDAVKEGLEKKAELEKNVKHSSMVLKRINEQIRQINASVISSVDRCTAQLDEITESEEI